jgi:thiol-disulfide isomerase/thioredoxin
MKNSSKILTELAWFIGFMGLFYLLNSGGWVQWLFLQTGLFSPQPKTDSPIIQAADYNLQVLDLEGNTINLNDLKGKTIFINIWATWCPPCLAEMPGIESLYQKTKQQNIAFVLISVDEDPEVVRKFVSRKKYKFPIYFLQSQLPHLYQHNSIPRTYVISPAGKLVYTHQGIAQYDSPSFHNFLLNLSK